MKADPLALAAVEVAASWEKEAEQRRARTPSDPAAETLQSCAVELRERIAQAERDTAYLTVDQYATSTGVSASTIRRLCARGLLDGAERDIDNDWRIPRAAKRLAQPRTDVADVAVAS
jgi:AraC-like DNA-binding protein